MVDKDESAQDEEMLGRLIAAAGRGPEPSPEARKRIYTAVRARWDAQTRRRIWPARALGMAATVAAVAITLVWLQNDPAGPNISELARFSHVTGDVELTRDGEERRLESLEATGPILTGDVLRTAGDGQAVLLRDDGTSLRIHIATVLSFAERNEFDLLAGTVYVDSGETGVSSEALEIDTPLGRVRHVGTQYEVHLADSALRVRVREGSVAISGGTVDTLGSAGEQLEVESNGLIARTEIPPDDAVWRWAIGLARLPESSEYNLHETLTWIARERGLILEYSTPAVRDRSGRETVLGLEGFDPFDALDVLERTANVQAEIDGMRLVVSNP